MTAILEDTNRWLRAALKHANLSQSGLALELSERLDRKVHKQTVQNMSQGTRRIRVDELIAIAEITGYQLPSKSDALMRNKSPRLVATTGRQRLPVQERTAKMSTTREDWMMPLLRALRLRGAEPRIVEIFGDAGFDPAIPQAEGSLRPGDHVIVDVADTNPASPGPFLVADPHDVETMFVRFLEIIEDGMVKMSSRNPLYEPVKKPLADAGIVGRVRARISITRL